MTSDKVKLKMLLKEIFFFYQYEAIKVYCIALFLRQKL